MKFNVYLDRRLGEAVAKLARRKKVSRSALIRQAVADLLHRERTSDTWSPRVLAWRGDPQIEPFEAHRSGLAGPADYGQTPEGQVLSKS